MATVISSQSQNPIMTAAPTPSSSTSTSTSSAATATATATATGYPTTFKQPQPPLSNQLTPPDSNPTTPKGHSPSSPRSNWPSVNTNAANNISFASKQIRSPRAPMYVPAVLRPTEVPNRSSPPNRLNTSSPSNAHSTTTTDMNTSLHSSTTSLTPSEPQTIKPTRPKPQLRRMVTEEWQTSCSPSKSQPPTGPPSRNHWKPDPSSPSCDSPTCIRSFSFLTRRHHCRRCGHIFCADHSFHEVPLDQHARFHAEAAKFRACDDCWRDWKVWEGERVRRKNEGSAETEGGEEGGVEGVDIKGSGNGNGNGNGGILNAIAASVPRDWNWSTF